MRWEKLNKLMLARDPEFRLFWKSLGLKHRFRILAAIGVTFASIGFVVDLVGFPEYRALPLLLAAVAAIGLMAVVMAVLTLKSMRMIVPAVLVLVAGIFLLSWLTAPNGRWNLPADQAAFVRRLTLDAGGMLFCSMLGYALFLTFISDEGVKRVRFMTEISLAKDLHEALVPPIDRTVAGLEVYGKALPSSEIGGDLLDLWDDGETVSVYVADVSGHGVTAGAMMGMAKSAIRVQLASGQALDCLFETLNDVLVDLTPSNMFLTLVSVRFKADRTEICSAGHQPVLRYSKDSGKIERIHSQQIPIAFLKKTDYCCSTAPRVKGDLFVLLTDGITEVRNAAGGMFGLERVEEIIGRMPDAPLAGMHEAIMDAARKFGEQEDDQTLLIVRA
jgi:hypothetical protein